MAARDWVLGVMSALPFAAAAAPPASEADMAAAFFEFLGEEVDTDDELGKALLSGDLERAKDAAERQPEVGEHEQQTS